MKYTQRTLAFRVYGFAAGACHRAGGGVADRSFRTARLRAGNCGRETRAAMCSPLQQRLHELGYLAEGAERQLRPGDHRRADRLPTGQRPVRKRRPRTESTFRVLYAAQIEAAGTQAPRRWDGVLPAVRNDGRACRHPEWRTRWETPTPSTPTSTTLSRRIASSRCAPRRSRPSRPTSDTASYAQLRAMILAGEDVPVDSVRIEEMLNYFHYDYNPPEGDQPFGRDHGDGPNTVESRDGAAHDRASGRGDTQDRASGRRTSCS